MKITLKTLQQKQYEVEVPDDATVRLSQSINFYDNLDVYLNFFQFQGPCSQTETGSRA